MLNDVLAFASTCAALCCELCPQGSYGLIYISFTKKQKLGAIRNERQTSAAYFHEHKKGNLPSQPGAPKTCSPEDNVFREADTKRKIDVKELRSIGLNETHKARRRRRWERSWEHTSGLHARLSLAEKPETLRRRSSGERNWKFNFRSVLQLARSPHTTRRCGARTSGGKNFYFVLRRKEKKFFGLCRKDDRVCMVKKMLKHLKSWSHYRKRSITHRMPKQLRHEKPVLCSKWSSSVQFCESEKKKKVYTLLSARKENFL